MQVVVQVADWTTTASVVDLVRFRQDLAAEDHKIQVVTEELIRAVEAEVLEQALTLETLVVDQVALELSLLDI
jgi:hypothetical protein